MVFDTNIDDSNDAFDFVIESLDTIASPLVIISAIFLFGIVGGNDVSALLPAARGGSGLLDMSATFLPNALGIDKLSNAGALTIISTMIVMLAHYIDVRTSRERNNNSFFQLVEGMAALGLSGVVIIIEFFQPVSDLMLTTSTGEPIVQVLGFFAYMAVLSAIAFDFNEITGR